MAISDALRFSSEYTFYPIPRRGEPGDETWGGLPLQKRIHVGAWFVGSYDPVSTVNLEVIPQNIEESYGLVCPGVDGGKNWPTTAYSPKTGLLYAPLQNLCMEPIIATTDPKPDDWYAIAMPGRLAPEKTSVGRLEAISVRTGRTAWKFEERAGMFSALTTGGGLVFAGNSNRRFRAFDAENGDILWQMILNGPVTGFPFTYAVDGEQYVAVAVGGGDILSGAYNRFADFKVRGGSNVLYSFKVSGTAGGQMRIATGASQSEAELGGSRLERSAPSATESFAEQRARLPSSAACASFTAAQVERGRELYVQKCADCHGPTLRGGSHGLPLSGRIFRGRWSNRPTSAFFATLRETMPPGGKETLSGATSDLVAFILSENGAQPIGDAMGEEPAALRQLRLCPASE